MKILSVEDGETETGSQIWNTKKNFLQERALISSHTYI